MNFRKPDSFEENGYTYYKDESGKYRRFKTQSEKNTIRIIPMEYFHRWWRGIGGDKRLTLLPFLLSFGCGCSIYFSSVWIQERENKMILKATIPEVLSENKAKFEEIRKKAAKADAEKKME